MTEGSLLQSRNGTGSHNTQNISDILVKKKQKREKQLNSYICKKDHTS